MNAEVLVRDPGRLDELIEPMLRTARIPGAAIAIVADGATVFAKGYGYRDLSAKLPLTAATVYPIASTSKAINATLLGMLVDDELLAWDAPVRRYLPHFALKDPLISPLVTVRDLIVMRTGLPRHDWAHTEEPLDRAELVRRLRHLELSAGFRERFQYNNLTVTTAGHIAEAITGRSWEELVQARILAPLGMQACFDMPDHHDVTFGYHENGSRQLQVTQRLETSVTAPSGGALHSTVESMARWVAFNMSDGRWQDRVLIRPQTLHEIRSPQIVMPNNPAGRKSNATYAMGWTLDSYNGCPRLSHGGYLHDVNSEIVMFPRERIGIVAFVNFGPPMLALLIAEHAFDLLTGRRPVHSLEDRLSQYEGQIQQIRQRDASLRRVPETAPSHSIEQYIGVYVHPGYGSIEIRRNGPNLILARNNLVLPLQHWHYDAWAFGDNGLFEIHLPHAFDAAGRVRFETSADGDIAAFSIGLEPAVAPVRFEKRR
jgi:CubicO group peptidase (beta-lactamase class C family)